MYKEISIINEETFLFLINEIKFQTVPFTINSFHIELFKPELYLSCCLFLIVLMSVYLRKFYNRSDVAIITYKSVCITLLISFILQLKKLYYLKLKLGLRYPNILIFNSAIDVGIYSIVIKVLLFSITIVLLLLGISQFKKAYFDKVEFSILIGFSTLFLAILISSCSLLTLYLAIEGLSLTGYILAAYPFKQDSFEAAIKYFSLGALSSGVLLYGIVIIYGITGSFDFHDIKSWIEISEDWERSQSNLLILRDVGIGAILFGICFKLAIFPCHMWALDVYEGTWLPVTSFFMTVVKVGVFCIFLRLFTHVFFGVYFMYRLILISSLGSLFIGSIGALSQRKLKRFFTYSSLSQLGFSLLGVVSGTMQGLESAIFFFILYLICSLGIFIILLNTEKYINGKNIIFFTDFTNFGKYNFKISLSLCLIFFSMAGIPPLAGFFSKALIIKALIESSFYWLAIYSIIVGAINTFVYIRLIKCILSDKSYRYNNKDTDKEYSDYFVFSFFYFNLNLNEYEINIRIIYLKTIFMFIYSVLIFLFAAPVFLSYFLSIFNIFIKSIF